MLSTVSATGQPRDAERRAVPAVIAMFVANAGLYASFATRIPAIRDGTGSTTTELGVALLCLAAGSIAGMHVGGRLITRNGSAPILLGSLISSAVTFPVIGVLGSPQALMLGTAALGLAYGPWDVAMNVQASHVETVLARPLMSRFHGCWSLGALAGAGVGALLAQADVPVGWHLAGSGVIALAIGLAAIGRFVPDRLDQPRLPSEAHPRSARRRLLALGALTVCATLIEGAAADWLALYLTDERAAGPGLAASGYVVFAVSMAVGRLAGTTVIERIGPVRVLRLAGSVAGLGLLSTIALPGIAGALIGSVGWGLGIALVFPTAMSAAAVGSPRPAEAIARVATIGYAGFFAGPPLIGFVGDVVGLGWGLACCLPLTLGIVALAARAGPPAASEV